MSGMFTTCPGCRMNLAVTAMDLRVGQGYVRCGRCDRVFNALLSLSEDLDPDEQSGHSAIGTASVPALVEEPPQEQQQAAPEPEAGLEIMPVEVADASGPEASEPDEETDAPDVDVVDSQATGTFETIVLEGDGYLQTEEHIDEQELELQLQEIARQIGSQSDAANEELEPEPAQPEEIDPDAAVGNRPRVHWAWSVAAVLLLLGLAAQIIHHHRQSLVAVAWLETPLQRIYGLFGVTLEPAWDLAAYDLRQLGSEETGSGAAVLVRASVHNRSPGRQPPPLIRAVLKDRFGNTIATSDIAPQDYLRGPAPARLAPDQRIDVELVLADPNRQAIGYELDTCLPAADQRIHCSNDP